GVKRTKMARSSAPRSLCVCCTSYLGGSGHGKAEGELDVVVVVVVGGSYTPPWASSDGFFFATLRAGGFFLPPGFFKDCNSAKTGFGCSLAPCGSVRTCTV